MDIVITHEMQMLIGRMVLLASCTAISLYIAFKQTPELDGVKSATFYRFCYSTLIIRALGFIAFTIFGLFPME